MLSDIGTYILNLIESLGMFGPLLGCLLILTESILPIMPISIFIALNFYAFGNLFGFLISYILTVAGCNLSFYLSRRILKNRMDILSKKYEGNKILSLIKKISKMKLKDLTVLMAFPFTPAFVINIAAGISKMEFKKFLYSTIISKAIMVYFWGYIGVSFIESFTHPVNLIKIFVLLIIAYALSSLFNKKFDLDRR